jgi:hypothetical protein
MRVVCATGWIWRHSTNRAEQDWNIPYFCALQLEPATPGAARSRRTYSSESAELKLCGYVFELLIDLRKKIRRQGRGAAKFQPQNDP